MPQKKRPTVPAPPAPARRPHRYRRHERAHRGSRARPSLPRSRRQCRLRAPRPAPWTRPIRPRLSRPRRPSRQDQRCIDRTGEDASCAPETIAHDAQGTIVPRAPGDRRARRLDGSRHGRPAPAPLLAADGTERLSILMVTPEAHPFAKTGGLAEVAAALPAGAGRAGTRRDAGDAAIPRRSTPAARLPFPLAFRLAGHDLPVDVREKTAVERRPARAGGCARRCSIAKGCTATQRRLSATTPGGSRSSAAPRSSSPRAQGSRPSIIHAHDWQAGLVAGLPEDAVLDRSRSSAACRSSSRSTTWRSRGCSRHRRSTRSASAGTCWTCRRWSSGAASVISRAASTSASGSRRSARPTRREIQTPELGFGFDGILRRRAADLVGILNGIDTDALEPGSGRVRAGAVHADDPGGQAAAKAALLEAAGIAGDARAMARPLIGLVSRLTDQKGFDLIAARGRRADVARRVVGDAGQRRAAVRGPLARAGGAPPGRVSATIGFDERLAHLIEAARTCS